MPQKRAPRARRAGMALTMILALPAMGGAATSTGPSAATMETSPCPDMPEVRCGTLEVFEDRAARSGRKIPLHIAVVPATGPQHAPDPIFMLAGGPGQSAAAFLQGGLEPLAPFRRTRDLVLVDQRGTGKSNPLPCRLLGKAGDPASLFADIFPIEEVRSCRETLSARADLTKYGTSPAMDDLDDVRAALGYEKINVWGGSYGTFAAQVYLRQHPDRVRAVVMEGVASLDYKLPLPFARGFQNSMDRLLKDCAADGICAAAVPNAREEFTALLARLEKEPERFTFHGKPVVLARGPFVERLRLMLYAPQLASLTPLILHQAHAGNWGPFAGVSELIESGLAEGMSMGMYLSVTCPEGLNLATPAEIEKATAGTWMGDYRVRTHQRACAEWPRAPVTPDFLEPVVSDAPVLLISGELDPVTPPGTAEAVASHMPNARVVAVPNGSHFTTTPCVEGIIGAFLEKGSAKGLDVSCVRENRRPPFPPALPPIPAAPS